MDRPKILIVEDEWAIAESIKGVLENLQYEVADVVQTGECAIKAADENELDLILMDIVLASEMPGTTAQHPNNLSYGIFKRVPSQAGKKYRSLRLYTKAF